MTKYNTSTRRIKDFLLFFLNFRQGQLFIKQFAEKFVYVCPAILLFLSPAMATATGFLPPVYHLLFHTKNKRIFILGSSTVHTANYISGDFNDPYGADRRLQGWGEQLYHYAKDPGKIYNRARSGSDSVSYRTPYRDDEAGYKDRHWGKTEELINATNDGNGGFLLIQFGANDPFHNVSVEDFQNELRAYIADARRLELTPVLISPINHRNHYNSRPYAQHIEPVAVEQDVLFLDLHQKSITVWAGYAVNEDYDGDGLPDNDFYQTLPEADIIYGFLQYHAGINNNHLSPIGAQLVAGWVKELACQSDREDGRMLCAQFLDEIDDEVPPCVAVIGEADITVDQGSVYTDKGATASDDVDGNISANIITAGAVDTLTPGTYTITYSVHDNAGNDAMTQRTVHVIDPVAETVVIYEDAEDGNTDGWETYGIEVGSTITNVEDGNGHVIELHGNDGLDNGFKFINLNITSGFVASWRLNYANRFRFFAIIRTEDSPDNNIYLEYTPDDLSTGVNGSYIHNGLGADAMDGTWHSFTRDLEADLNVVYPDDHITQIIGFSIRGSGRIDDISTSTRGSYATFSYGGHRYEIVKNTLSWQDAVTAAHDAGGYLANIGSIAENHEIYSRLFRFIEQNEYGDTVAANGGGASYVWIGGNDIDAEGTWVWENNTAQFWSGGINGQPQGGLFSNWGRDINEDQHEPDNANNIQDAAGIALNSWPVPGGSLGQTSHWNDLNIANELFYIIEYNN